MQYKQFKPSEQDDYLAEQCYQREKEHAEYTVAILSRQKWLDDAAPGDPEGSEEERAQFAQVQYNRKEQEFAKGQRAIVERTYDQLESQASSPQGLAQAIERAIARRTAAAADEVQSLSKG